MTVPVDPLMTDEELEELWNRLPGSIAAPVLRRSWWYRWWPKLSLLAAVMIFWLFFWFEASR